MAEVEKIVKRTQKAEEEVESLFLEFEALQKLNLAELTKVPEELEKLRGENTKLKYRLGILKRATDKEGGQKPRQTTTPNPKKKAAPTPKINPKHHMKSILNTLIEYFEDAIARAFPDIPEPPCPVSVSTKAGDYQFNGALAIVGILKSDLIDKVEVAGPGFVNIFLKKTSIEEQVNEILKHGVRPPIWPGGKKRVVVDFSSPNVAKEMHVGHLRSTIIGDSTANLMEFLGHDVLRLNHIGDWGTQFGMLIAHLKDRFPDFATQPPPIGDLQSFYKESKTRFDEDEAFKKRAYEAVVKLQSHDKTHLKGWSQICDVSRKEFQKVYERLNVKNLTERGESFYQDRMKATVELLTSRDLLEDDDGRKIMFGTKCPLPLTIVKSDGGFTYDTSDMAALRQRIEEEKADWIVYMTDAGQGLHFQAIFDCARKAGILSPATRVDHVGFGVVLGEDKKKFKTRSGDTVRLVDLLDEGLKRAKDKLLEKEREKVLSEAEMDAAQKAIAYGCIKYADLSHNRNPEYVFSFDKMLEDKGNTAAYMLYAYTRICSIGRAANLSQADIVKARKTTPVSLDHEKELKLGKLLVRFPEIILKIAEELFLHTLCEFMYDVAGTFTEFYDACYCVEKNKAGEVVKVNMGRIMLCDATAQILAKCFDILGLQPPAPICESNCWFAYILALALLLILVTLVFGMLKLNDQRRECLSNIKNLERKCRDLEKVKENMDRDQSQACTICCREKLEILVIPCHHIFCCTQCAVSITSCAICRERIQDKKRVYIA
eukprot:maker-scaffold294_size218657-snap-gene-1.25 protein:Tk10442 transcript:maker-scaffold294_size218657-snap-gene-1.25-mRNA-1 annotation:"arginyl-trna synthetase"